MKKVVLLCTCVLDSQSSSIVDAFVVVAVRFLKTKHDWTKPRSRTGVIVVAST